MNNPVSIGGIFIKNYKCRLLVILLFARRPHEVIGGFKGGPNGLSGSLFLEKRKVYNQGKLLSGVKINVFPI